MYIKLISLILTFLFLSSCSLDQDYIRRREWKYGEGYWLHHDFIAFGGYFSLRNDTILIGDSAIAIIYETEKGYFGNDKEIHIKSTAANKPGVYHDYGPLKPEDTTVQIILTPPPHVDEPPVPPSPPLPKNDKTGVNTN